jgi:hypothetical protein
MATIGKSADGACRHDVAPKIATVIFALQSQRGVELRPPVAVPTCLC